MKNFSKIYKFVSLAIFIFSLILLPFLKYIIKDANQIGNLYFIYYLFVIEVILSYLMYSKISIIVADQKEYIKLLSYCIFNYKSYYPNYYFIFHKKLYNIFNFK